ncbi:glycosyltransferase [Azospirillum sp. sgz301742]
MDARRKAAVRAAVPLTWVGDGHAALAWRHGVALCRALAAQGRAVTACVAAEESVPEAALRALADLPGIRVETAPEPSPRLEGNVYARLAYRFYAWARERAFDEVHAVDLYGLPYYCLLARAAGRRFTDTAFALLEVGPSRALFQDRGGFPQFDTLGRFFLEDECRVRADGVRPLAEARLPAAEVGDPAPDPAEPAPGLRLLAIGEDVADGDLRFLAKALRQAGPARTLTLVDLARVPDAGAFAGLADALDVRTAAEAEVPDLLRAADLVVLPGRTADAAWLAVLCRALRVPVVGRGHAGLAPFAPGLAPCGPPADLAARLVPGLSRPEPLPVPDLGLTPPQHPASPAPAEPPLVSVCVTHFNRPHLLRQALASLAAQDYPALELVVVDDGSDQPEALACLDALEATPPVPRFRLVRQANRYLGAARNAAAAVAAGDFLLFMDDDNLAKPGEVSVLAAAALASGADIVTCFNDTFSGERDGVPVAETRRVFLGPAAEVGVLFNAFGDANALIRADAFRQLGGFSEDYGVGHEDYEFFARAVLAGLNLLTVPEALFWYRLDAGSMINTTSLGLNHIRALRPYLSGDRLKADLAALARGTFVETERTVATLLDDGRRKQEAIEALQGELVQRQLAVEDLLADSRAKQNAIETLRADIAEKQNAVEALDAVNAEKQRAIETLRADIVEKQRDIEALDAANAEKQRAIEAMRNSWSWRLTLPLRRGVRLARRLLGMVRYRRHTLELEPLAEVSDEGGVHHSLGHDPHFLLRPAGGGGLPRGWTRLTYSGRGIDHPLVPELYVDSGAGFSEAGRVSLPLLREGSVTQTLRLPDGVAALRFDPLARPGRFRLDRVEALSIGTLPLLVSLARRHPRRLLAGLAGGVHGIARAMAELVAEENAVPELTYRDWIACFDDLDETDRAAIATRVTCLTAAFTVVVPADGVKPEDVAAAVDSVRGQLYPRWRLVVLGGTVPPGAASDPRVTAAPDAAALSEAAEGWLAFLDPAARLAPHALYLAAERLAAAPDTALLYGDEDRLDDRGQRSDPWFKPDWSPDLFCAQNYLGSLVVLERTALDPAVPAADLAYAAVLRLLEWPEEPRVEHVPFVLSHSTGESVDTARRGRERALLAAHLHRCGVTARVEPWLDGEANHVLHALPTPAPAVSIVIPTKDKIDLLRQCIESLRARTDYPGAVEILVIDNRSETEEARAYFAELERTGAARVLAYDAPFNYSAINNFGAAQATGNLLAFLNNDIEVIAPGWLAEMAGHALRSAVGAVGTMLYYPDDTVQHAGVGLGLNELVGHLHKGLPRAARGHAGRAALAQNFSAVTAACLVMRRSVFDELGGFEEEHLHVAFNDVDLCLRLRERGYRIVWTPHAEMYHHEGASRGRTERPERLAQFAIEVGFMMKRWAHVAAADPYYNPNLTLEREDLSLAWPPRIMPPWRLPSTFDEARALPIQGAADDAVEVVEAGRPAERSPE